LQKEACSKHVVAKVVKPSLGTHTVTKEENILRDDFRAFHDGDVLSKELREEVPTSEVQWINASLAQPQNDDLELKEED
jgi:hypothetical protein